jgi:very-long-chain enoyl-CoA reductase
VCEIEVVDAKSSKNLARLSELFPTSTIEDVKKSFQRAKPSYYVDRQSFRLDARGKTLKDSETLQSLGLGKGGKLFFRDLGPQVGWKTVFLTEYAGPLVIYLIFYTRPSLIYGMKAASSPKDLAVHVACGCWTFHYAKRLLETIFVHRFSHSTMPIRNIFKNSAYYWGFTAFVAYFNNHPLYTPPVFGVTQLYAGLALFTLCELGNFSIHVALRNLRPPGTKERRIPRASWNPFTWLFNFVSCPNYTYEVGSWVGFSILSQSLPAALFTLVGFAQMTQWAFGKHKNYRADFKDYPRQRKAIIPLLL